VIRRLSSIALVSPAHVVDYVKTITAAADLGTMFRRQGDVVWIPENTPLKYEGDKAMVFYALHPVDWRQKHGIA